MLVAGTMRPFWPAAVVVIMTIGAADNAADVVGSNETWHVGVFTNSLDRMVGGIPGIKLLAFIYLIGRQVGAD